MLIFLLFFLQKSQCILLSLFLFGWHFVLFCFFLSQVSSKSFTIIVVDNDFRSHKFSFVSSTVNVVVVAWAVSARSVYYYYSRFYIFERFLLPLWNVDAMQIDEYIKHLMLWSCFSCWCYSQSVECQTHWFETSFASSIHKRKSSYFNSRLKSIKSIKLNKMIMISITNCDLALANSHWKYWKCCCIVIQSKRHWFKLIQWHGTRIISFPINLPSFAIKLANRISNFNQNRLLSATWRRYKVI